MSKKNNMSKQTHYLLSEIEKLVDSYDLQIKYEYNTDINIHFVRILSNTLTIEDINNLSDALYERFVEVFPGSIVAIMDQNDKYTFRFESLFDNTNVSETLYEEVLFNNNIYFSDASVDFFELSEKLSKKVNHYSKKTLYKDNICLKESFLKSPVLDNSNEELALAA